MDCPDGFVAFKLDHNEVVEQFIVALNFLVMLDARLELVLLWKCLENARIN